MAQQAAAKGHKVIVISPDKDLLQLVDENISVFHPTTTKPYSTLPNPPCLHPLTALGLALEYLLEKYRFEPKFLPHLQALTGDAVDNSTALVPFAFSLVVYSCSPV